MGATLIAADPSALAAHPAFHLPAYFEQGATLIWAMSSAMLAARRGYAIMGVITLAVVGSAGGGLLRDGLFLQNGPPVLVTSPEILILIACGIAAALAFGSRLERLRYLPRAVVVLDAIGLGAYGVVGIDRALSAGISQPGAVVVGMVNAVGGGILRDILLNREPSMFQPGVIEEAAALAGCLLFLGLINWSVLGYQHAAWLTIAAVFTVRLAAVRFQLSTRPIRPVERTGD